jgi:hypothetical protein
MYGAGLDIQIAVNIVGIAVMCLVDICLEKARIRRECEFGGQVAAALDRERECRAKPRGGSVSSLEAQSIGSACRTAGPDFGGDRHRAAQAAVSNQPQLALAFSRPTQHHPKKRLQIAEQQRADVGQARRRWIRDQGMVYLARLVLSTSPAVSTNMVRLRGRAVRGVRLIGHVPLGAWETIKPTTFARRRAGAGGLGCGQGWDAGKEVRRRLR